jgi:riboflavin kinase/FMN adenylyltransferase
MSERKRVVALGFFDGVHLGHAALLELTRRRAAELGAAPAVLSFDVHPDTVVRGVEVPLINAAEGRTDLIRRLYGIEDVVFVHFSRAVMHMPWQEFIEDLARETSAVHFVVGYDFCFGWKGEGTGEKLRAYCAAHGMGCDVVPAVKVDGLIVSSTAIRALIAEGDMEAANRMLGHPHSLIDTVHFGYHLGATMGAPTINMQFPQGVLEPKHGVYATKVYPDTGEEHLAVTNVGVRPTFGGDKVSVESYILDFSGDLYGHRVRVEFYRFLRPEQRFDSPEALSAQIARDAEDTRAYFRARPDGR